MDWELVRGDVKGLNLNEVIRLSSLNEALLRVIRNRVPKRTIMFRTRDKSWFNDPCDLAHRVKQRVYRVWRRSKTQANWEEYTVARHHAQLYM